MIHRSALQQFCAKLRFDKHIMWLGRVHLLLEERGRVIHRIKFTAKQCVFDSQLGPSEPLDRTPFRRTGIGAKATTLRQAAWNDGTFGRNRWWNDLGLLTIEGMTIPPKWSDVLYRHGGWSGHYSGKQDAPSNMASKTFQLLPILSVSNQHDGDNALYSCQNPERSNR